MYNSDSRRSDSTTFAKEVKPGVYVPFGHPCVCVCVLTEHKQLEMLSSTRMSTCALLPHEGSIKLRRGAGRFEPLCRVIA